MPMQLFCNITDRANRKSTVAMWLPTTFSISQYTEFAQALAVIIDSAVHGKIHSIQMHVPIDVSALNFNLLDAYSDVEEVANFAFDCADDTIVSVRVPCLDENLVVDNSNQLNIGATAVDDFINAMLGGITTSGGQMRPCNIAEGDITAMRKAEEQFRSSYTRGSR